jgi:hypothetical protein
MLQVGAGIYSGRVKRDAAGEVVWGRQYADHNSAPGPVYDGNGYTDMAKAIHTGPEAVKRLLAAASDPKAAANEIMTGGARPLHTCVQYRAVGGHCLPAEWILQRSALTKQLSLNAWSRVMFMGAPAHAFALRWLSGNLQFAHSR